MNEAHAKTILDETVGQIFGYQNPLNLDQAMTRFAFDVRLPQQVFDSISGEPTWVAALGQGRYMTMDEVRRRLHSTDELRPHRDLQSIDQVLGVWDEINYASSERQIASTNVAECDGVYHSDMVYRSIDVRKSKNILFSDGVDDCDHVVAGQTSKKCAYSIRVEDSKNITASFNVVWSNKIKNSFFIQDCYDLEDCMFCAHLAGKRFCIANIQYNEADYRRIKDMVMRWALQS